jgi:predicted XRE-type DNA-binding protein
MIASCEQAFVVASLCGRVAPVVGKEARGAMRVVRMRTDKVAALIKLRDWTPKQIAHAVGVSQAQVSRILRGVQNPGPRFIAGWLEAAGQEFKFEDFFFLDFRTPSR